MKRYAKAIIFSLFLFSIPFSFNVNSSGELLNTIVATPNYASAIDLNCGTADFSCGITEGILNVWEILWFYSTQVILVLVGYILDIFIFLSIDSNFYRSGLIETGWEILRDFTNIAFIFSFLVMAFKMTLKVDSGGTKKQLMKTILVALTVNFSLFIGLAIIDASNLLAHVFYNKIEAKGNYKAQALDQTDENASSLSKFITDFVSEDTRSVSLAVASNVNPQIIITGNAGKGFFENFIIITGAGLINVMLIYIFIKMVTVFLGRTLGLMFSTMLSAIAFTTLTLPNMANKKYIGFNKWLEELISTAFMAPVFLFFIYLAVTFLKDKGFLASLAPKPGQDFLTRLLVVFVPFLIIGGILMLAKKISSDMVGELGKMAVKGVGMLAGGIIAAPLAVTAGAAAIGGVAAAGGGALASGVGGAATRMGASRMGGALSKVGRGASKFGRKAMSFKADPTKLPGFKNLVGKDMSKSINKVMGKSALGHIEDVKKRKGVFGSDYDKITSDRENAELKGANDAANNARRNAENKFESELYQKRFEEELARKKRDEKKDSFTDKDGNEGGYKEAQKQSKEESETIKDLNATLQSLKKEKDDLGDVNAGNMNSHQDKQREIDEVEVKIQTSQANKQTADSYIENISVDYNNKKAEAQNLRAEQKAAGDAAESTSRQQSAAKASTGRVAEKILKKEKAKGSGLEDAIKKAMKDNNISLDDDK